MSRFTRRLTYLLVPLALLATACGSDDDDGKADTTTTAASDGGSTDAEGFEPQPLDEPASITIVAPPPGEFVLPLMTALANDEFEKENLTIELTTTDPTSGFGLLARGDAQLMATGFLPATINAMNEGLPLVWVGTLFQGTTTKEGFWLSSEYLNEDGTLDKDALRADKPIMGSLTGPTGLAAYPMYRYFEDQGVSAETGDYSVQTFGTTGDMVIALENGSIGGAYLTSPFYASFEEAGTAELVAASFGTAFDGDDNVWRADPPVYGAVWLASRDFLESKPEVAEAFYRAIARTIDTYLQGDYKNGEYADMLAAAIEQTPEQLSAAEGYFVFEADQPALTKEAMEQVIDFWLDVEALAPNDGDELDFDPDEFTVRTPIDAVTGS